MPGSWWSSRSSRGSRTVNHSLLSEVPLQDLGVEREDWRQGARDADDWITPVSPTRERSDGFPRNHEGWLRSFFDESVAKLRGRSYDNFPSYIRREGSVDGDEGVDQVIWQYLSGRDENWMGEGDGSKELESLDFDPVNTPFWVDLHRHPATTLLSMGYAALTSKYLYRWVFTVVIGVGVAISAQLVQFCITVLINMRNDVLQSYVDQGLGETHGFNFFAGYNAVLVLVAGLLVVILEPSASGDGMAEIKAYLNGTHVVHCFTVTAMVVRFLGTILASAAALACGPEGPLVCIGAGIAYAVTSIDKIQSLIPSLPPSFLARFHNDRDRREFICAGAGAGIAAAFGAPVGGVLLAMEETASHWSPQLMWRIFTAALVATFTLALVKAGGNEHGDVSLAGLLSFGNQQSLGQAKQWILNPDGTPQASALDAPIYYWEILLFVLLGIIGGVLGGLFNVTFNFLHSRRPKQRTMKMIEVLCLSLVTSYSVYALATAYPHCRNEGSWTCRDADNWGEWCSGPTDNTTCTGPRSLCVNASGWVCVGGGNDGFACRGRGDCEWRGGACVPVKKKLDFGLRLACSEGEYDELGTLFFGSKEQSIARMVVQAWPHEPFSDRSLLIVSLVHWVLMLFTYGSPLPCGFFMPSWLLGASIGRLFGQVVRQYAGLRVFSGAYALAGAAAVLGAVQRASISLVFIVVEGTANIHFLLPVVMTTVVANVVALQFTKEGIYDMVTRHRMLRFLKHEPNWLLDLCSVDDVMAQNIVTFRTVETIGTIVDTLRNCTHNGFPILCVKGAEPIHTSENRENGDIQPTENGDHDHPPSGRHPTAEGRVEGVILRSHLRTILGTRFMRSERDKESLWTQVTAESLGHLRLDGVQEMHELIEYRRSKAEFATVKEWEWGMFSAEDRSRFVNMGAYMNAACD